MPALFHLMYLEKFYMLAVSLLFAEDSTALSFGISAQAASKNEQPERGIRSQAPCREIVPSGKMFSQLLQPLAALEIKAAS